MCVPQFIYFFGAFRFFFRSAMFFDAQLDSVVKKKVKTNTVDPIELLKNEIPKTINRNDSTSYLKKRQITPKEEEESESKAKMQFSTVHDWLHKYAHLGLCVTILERKESSFWKFMKFSCFTSS